MKDTVKQPKAANKSMPKFPLSYLATTGYEDGAFMVPLVDHVKLSGHDVRLEAIETSVLIIPGLEYSTVTPEMAATLKLNVADTLTSLWIPGRAEPLNVSTVLVYVEVPCLPRKGTLAAVMPGEPTILYQFCL